MDQQEKRERRRMALVTAISFALIAAAGFWVFENGRNVCTVSDLARAQLANLAGYWQDNVALAPLVKDLQDGVDLTDSQFFELVKKTESDQVGPPNILVPPFDGEGRAIDPWGRPLHFMAFTVMREGVRRRCLKVWSTGANGMDEKGGGDDIVVEIKTGGDQ